MGDRKQLTAEEEAELGRRVRAWRDHGIDPEGGLAARNELVECNLRLVLWSLNRIGRLRGRSVEEYLPAGYSGLIRAATKFDPSVSRFSTYADRWIRHFAQRAIESDALIRIPAHVWHNPQKWQHLACGKRVRAHTGVEDYVLDAPVEAAREHDAAELAALVMGRVRLDPKERDILVRYFGLDGPAETLQSIADSYGVTRDAIRQRRDKALRILANAARGPLRESFDASGYLRAV